MDVSSTVIAFGFVILTAIVIVLLRSILEFPMLISSIIGVPLSVIIGMFVIWLLGKVSH